MPSVPNIIPITDLRQDAANVLKKVRDSQLPTFITQRGRATAVMMSLEEYERAENERQVLRILAQGDKEIAEGHGYSLEEVEAAADRILDGE